MPSKPPQELREQLTERQRKVLLFIQSYAEQHGYPPTLRDIGRHFKIGSTNGVSDHLKALVRKGYLEREDLKSRALRPVLGPGGAGAETVDIPVVGKVAAGLPLLAVENVQDTVRIDKMFVGDRPGRELFALRVQGDSMIEDGIFDGDYLFVRKQPVAQPGEIVVALIGDEATVKRFYPEPDRLRFQPANAAMQPIYVSRKDARQVRILGTVVGVYRRVK